MQLAAQGGEMMTPDWLHREGRPLEDRDPGPGQGAGYVLDLDLVPGPAHPDPDPETKPDLE